MRPGLLITPLTLLSGPVGVAAAHIKGHVDGLFQSDIDPINWFLPQSASHSLWKAALRLGLGFEHKLSSRIHLRGDYVFTRFGTIRFNESVSSVDSSGEEIRLSDSFKSRLENHAFVLGLSYYFKGA